MTKSARKQRLSIYLDPAVMNRLAEHAARRDQSRSLIAEAAIESFLSPDAAEQQEAAITKRLDQVDRRMTRLERDVGISVRNARCFCPLLASDHSCATGTGGAGGRAPRLANATMPLLPPSAVASPRGRSSGRKSLKTLAWKTPQATHDVHGRTSVIF